MAKLPGARYPTPGALIAALEDAVWSPPPIFAPQNAAGPSAGYAAAGAPGAPFLAGAATPAGTGSAPGRPTAADGTAEPGVYATMLPDAGPTPTEYHSIGYEPLAQPQQRKKSPALLIAVLAVVLVGLLGGGTVFAWRNGWLPGSRAAEMPTPTATQEAFSTPTLTLTVPPTLAPTSTPTPTATTVPPTATTAPPTATPTPTATTVPPTATPIPPTSTPTPTATTAPPTATPVPPTATPTPTPEYVAPLSLSHSIGWVTCTSVKNYQVRFNLTVTGGTGTHTVYRDVDSQLVYGPGTEREFVYDLEWGAGYAAVGTLYARSGELYAESKFYVNAPDCKDYQ
jgi:hypothetical protein